MFAYIKFTKKCPSFPEKEIVSSSLVVNYKTTNPLSTKYKIKCGCSTKCTGSVTYVGDSIQEIKDLLKKGRPKWIPYQYLVSASENTSDEAPPKKKKTQSGKVNKEHKNLDETSVQIKRNLLTERVQNTKSTGKASATIDTKDREKNGCSSSAELNKVVQKPVHNSENKKHSSQNSGLEARKKIDKVASNNSKMKNYDKKVEIANPQSIFVDVEEPIILDDDEPLLEIEPAISETERLKVIIRDLRRKVIELETENRSLRNDNRNMQEKVVNCFTQVQSTVQNMSNASQQELENKIISGEILPVGEVNSATNEIHAGFGVWLDRDHYDTVRYQSNITPQKFIKGMATVIFSNEVLINSTVKGRKIGKPALSVTKINALKEISKHWMKVALKMDSEAIHSEMKKINVYLNHKISDLRKEQNPKPAKPREKRKKKSKPKSTETVEGEIDDSNSSRAEETLEKGKTQKNTGTDQVKRKKVEKRNTKEGNKDPEKPKDDKENHEKTVRETKDYGEPNENSDKEEIEDDKENNKESEKVNKGYEQSKTHKNIHVKSKKNSEDTQNDEESDDSAKSNKEKIYKLNTLKRKQDMNDNNIVKKKQKKQNFNLEEFKIDGEEDDEEDDGVDDKKDDEEADEEGGKEDGKEEDEEEDDEEDDEETDEKTDEETDEADDEENDDKGNEKDNEKDNEIDDKIDDKKDDEELLKEVESEEDE